MDDYMRKHPTASPWDARRLFALEDAAAEYQALEDAAAQVAPRQETKGLPPSAPHDPITPAETIPLPDQGKIIVTRLGQELPARPQDAPYTLRNNPAALKPEHDPVTVRGPEDTSPGYLRKGAPHATILDDPTDINGTRSNPEDMVKAALSVKPSEAAKPQAQGLTKPTLEEALVRKPKRSAEEIFAQKYASAVSEKMAAQGNLEGAAAFDAWIEKKGNKAKVNAWSAAMAAAQAGDTDTAISKAVDLYNKQVPDGMYATHSKQKDGTYQIELRRESDNSLVRQPQAFSPDDVPALIYAALSPEQLMQREMGRMDRKEEAKSARELEDYKHQQRIEIEGMKAAAEAGKGTFKTMNIDQGLINSLPEAMRAQAKQYLGKDVHVLLGKDGTPMKVVGLAATDPTGDAFRAMSLAIAQQAASTRQATAQTKQDTALAAAQNRMQGVTKNKDGSYTLPSGAVARLGHMTTGSLWKELSQAEALLRASGEAK
jgi:hypothetical protein